MDRRRRAARGRGARARRRGRRWPARARARSTSVYDRVMRLYDTLTRSLVELPPAPGPIRMYFCGPTVYQRVHIGNAVPFVLFDVAADAGSRRAGYETTLVHQHHRRQRQDLRRGAGCERRARRSVRRSGTSTTRIDSASAARRRAHGRGDDARDQIAMIEAADRRRQRIRVATGDVYFRVTASPTTAVSRVRSSTRCASRSRTRARRIPATSRSGRRTSRARTRGGSRPGGRDGPAGTSSARRCPRSTWARVRDPRRWAGSRLPASRERDRPVAVARARLRADLDAQRDAELRRARRCTSRPATPCFCQRCSTDWGRETVLLFFMTGHWRKPLDFSEATLTAARAQAETLRNALRGETRTRGRLAELRIGARGRLQHAGGARDPPRVGANRRPR